MKNAVSKLYDSSIKVASVRQSKCGIIKLVSGSDRSLVATTHTHTHTVVYVLLQTANMKTS